MYKVLWFDDKFKTSEGTVEDALLEDISLIGFTNANDGIKELLVAYQEYDAVLLDGLFYENAEQAGTDIDDSAFGQVARALSDLKAKGIFMPWFIYSGQKKFRKGTSPFIKLFKDESFAKGKIFDKNKDEDFKELCVEIKKAAANKPENQIRLSHSEVFQIFKNQYLDKSSEKFLIELLLKVSDTQDLEQPKNEFTKLRKIIEKLVDKAEELDLIPREIGTANLTRAIGFLCNADSDYRLTQDYFHPTVNFFLPVLVNILQDGSHSKNGMRYKADDFATSRDNGYFFKACLYQVLDVLIAFNTLFQKTEKNELSSVLWKKISIENLFEGPLDQDEKGHYHCGEYKFGYTQVNGKYSIGQQIRILSEDQNSDIGTKHLYPKFAVKFEAI